MKKFKTDDLIGGKSLPDKKAASHTGEDVVVNTPKPYKKDLSAP